MKFKITCRPRYNPWLKKYLNTKTFSKILALGILLNSIPINSFAGILSEDTRYETFEGGDITINNVLEEDKVDIEIEGNTLISPLRNTCYGGSSKIVDKLNNGRIDKKSSNGNYFMIDSDTNNYLKLKNNTTYTVNISGTLEFDTSNEVSVVPFYRIINDNGDGETTHIKYYKVKSQEYFNIKHVFSTKDEIMHSFGFFTNPCDNIKNINVFYHIIEGDWTNKKMPKYFEGIKSSFEDNIVTQEMINSGQEKAENLGKYKIEYKSTGKNKFNIDNSNFRLNSSQNRLIFKDNIFTLEYSTPYPAIIFDLTEYIPYWKGLQMRASCDFTNTNEEAKNIIYLRGYDINNNYYYLNNYNYTILDNLTRLELCIIFNNRDSALTGVGTASNIQIEEGTTITKHESYRESISTFYLNSPLLKDDTIEIINGQATHIHKYRQIEFDGSSDEGWFLNPDWSEYNSLLSIKRSVLNIPKSADIICDNFKLERFFDKTKDMTYSVYAGNLNFNIILEKNTTLEEWISYLKTNPLKVVYELDNIIYEPLKADLSVQLFEGTTHVSTNSTIPANLKVTVDRTINRATEAIELAKANPTIANLSRARYWTNLLKESTKKDELQEEINNNVDIVDLQLERKTISANLDLYIKCENMLSISLDTNQITFDDFSGVEDIEKLNAVNVSINSSLPYQLNAYLPTEIQNSDKSKTMDKSILNIKENSETEYKEFSNINEKVVLKDNCNSGNQLAHSIDIMLKGGVAHEKDVYKAVIKLEAEQK